MKTAAFVAAFLLTACAGFGVLSLKPGASDPEVRRLMGQPAMEFTNPDGSRDLAYPRGPLGTQTYMVREGRDGVVQSVKQVLNDDVFNAIQPGMTQEEVLRLIGPPREKMSFARTGHVAWDYKYRDTWGYDAIFSVTFDANGRVVSKISQRIERSHNF